MDFFYPNFNNDMWRIFGLVFFGDRNRFIAADGKHFDKTRITAFCEEKGIALYDTVYRAARLKDNASDKFLETVEPAPIARLIGSLPLCRTMAATGQKAAETVSGMFRCPVPATGGYETIDVGGREIAFYRLPSSSRAYPLSLDKKAEAYAGLFEKIL